MKKIYVLLPVLLFLLVFFSSSWAEQLNPNLEAPSAVAEETSLGEEGEKTFPEGSSSKKNLVKSMEEEQKRAIELTDRYEKLLEKNEEQSKRYDRILGGWERQQEAMDGIINYWQSEIASAEEEGSAQNQPETAEDLEE